MSEKNTVRDNPPVRRRKSRRRAFRRGLLIYSLAFLLLGGAALFGFCRYLSAYEQGRGAHAVSAWMEGKSEEDYRSLLLSKSFLTLTEFENETDILNAYFDASCAGKSFSFREAAGVSTAEKPVFTIKAGAADVARITLRQGESVGFGFHQWEVASVEPYISPYTLTSAAVALETLSGSPLYLNGVEVSERYLTADDLPVSDLSTLEQRYAQQPHLQRYEISGLYGALTVTDGQGAEITAVEEDGMPVYRPGSGEGYSFSVTVPAGSTVTVCGVPLTDAELTARSVDPLEGLDRFLGDGCSAAQLTYSVSGLYRQPEIEVMLPEGLKAEKTVGENGEIVYTPVGDKALEEEQLPLVKAFFEANMNYAAGNRSYLQSALEKTLYGTDLYNYFSNSTAAMIWASDTTIDYEYLNYENFIPRGEDCFTCNVSYKAKLSAQSWYTTNESELEDSYLLAFVRHQGVWYAASMSLLEDPVS